MDAKAKDTALGDLRVLDLADEKGLYCTKLLADLGADVIKIERPGGDPTRNIGPFYHDEPHPEKSLYFFNLNTNKRSITLNLDTMNGKDILKRLVKTADVMVETFPPGYLDEKGLSYSALKAINPALILTSITPFGQTGPYKDYKASDIVGVAMGGVMYLAGFAQDPPNRPGASQAYHMASLQGAVGTLIALYHRELTGEGQQVDVSMQECVAIAMETAMQYYDMRREIPKRYGGLIVTSMPYQMSMLGVYECKDGHIISMVAASRGGPTTVVNWMAEEGMVGDLKEEKWQRLLDLVADRQALIESLKPLRANPLALIEFMQQFAHVDDVFRAFVMSHTCQELYEEGQKRRLIIVPVNSAADLLSNAQLISRGYFVDVGHPELDTTLKYPGVPYRLAKTPARIARRAPLVGEHNLEIYQKELGFSREQLALLKAEGTI